MPLDPKQQPPYYTPATSPTPYNGIQSIYITKLTQSGTNDPVSAEDINNTLTGIVWTRSSTGVYIGTKTAAFPIGHTWVLHNLVLGNVGVAYIGRSSANTVQLSTWGINGIAQDNIAQEIQIQITITKPS